MQTVHTAHGKRIVRRDNREINLMRRGKFHNAVDVLRADTRHTDRVFTDSAVSGKGVNGFDFGIFPQFLNDRVFAASAAYD